MTSCLHALRARIAGAESGVPVEKSESLTALQVANYPLECRAAFLEATRKGHMARKSDIDEILDRYNLWLACFSD